MSTFSKTYRPWGYYEVIEKNIEEGYQIKKLVVYPSARLSYQSHNHREEKWIIHSGVAKIKLNEEVLTLFPGNIIIIPIGAKHSVENIGKINTVILEVQRGNYLEEDDIIRHGAGISSNGDAYQ